MASRTRCGARTQQRNADADWDRWPVADYLAENYRELHPCDAAIVDHHSAFYRRFAPNSFSRYLDDLRALVLHPDRPGVRVQFVKEQLTFTGEDTAMATLLLSVMGAFAEFERSLIRERQREGIALARQRGAYRGRARALNAEQVLQLRQRGAEGIPKATLAREYGISRETVYQYLRARLGS